MTCAPIGQSFLFVVLGSQVIVTFLLTGFESVSPILNYNRSNEISFHISLQILRLKIVVPSSI
jgi:hypothetical protein